ncbi:MAG: LysR family transcriptional regulator [Pseudomonadota bacterium]
MAASLRHLSYLLAVAENGSVTAAAEQLGVSQPAISTALRNIEADYDLSLFVRERPHKIALTAVGRRFVANARHLLETAGEFDDEARELKDSQAGVVDIGCFTPTAPFVIPMVLQRLKDRFPKIRIKLHEGDIDEINRLLTTGVIEVALTYDMYPNPAVQFEPLTEAYPYALLAAGDPLARSVSISLADLANRDMIAFDLPITQQYFHSLFIQHNLRPRIRHQVKSYEMVRSLVGAGEGYSILIMRPMNERAYSGDLLAYLPIRTTIAPPRYGLAFTNQYRPTKLVRTIAKMCRDLFAVDKKLSQYLVPPHAE